MPKTVLYRSENKGNDLIRSEGYSQSGEYKILRVNARWPIKPQYYNGDADKPVGVIFSGYRMRGGAHGRICNTLAGMLAREGFPSLIMDYGGFSKDKPETDPATMTTNIQDARDAIDFLGERPRIYIAMSYGINIAMQVPGPHIKHIIAPAGAPDIVQRFIKPVLLKDDFSAAAQGGDYVVADFGAPMNLGFTRRYYEDALRYSAFEAEMPLHAGISAIVSNDDPIVPPTLLSDWAGHLRVRGHFVTVSGIEKAGHNFAQHFLEAVTQETIKTARHYEQPAPVVA